MANFTYSGNYASKITKLFSSKNINTTFKTNKFSMFTMKRNEVKEI
jgi:hypothetical protein